MYYFIPTDYTCTISFPTLTPHVLFHPHTCTTSFPHWLHMYYFIPIHCTCTILFPTLTTHAPFLFRHGLYQHYFTHNINRHVLFYPWHKSTYFVLSNTDNACAWNKTESTTTKLSSIPSCLSSVERNCNQSHLHHTQSYLPVAQVFEKRLPSIAWSQLCHIQHTYHLTVVKHASKSVSLGVSCVISNTHTI